jgi:hypothetical protein
VSDFNALDDIGWITTAYFVYVFMYLLAINCAQPCHSGQAAFMLIFGKILAFAPTKAVLLAAIFLFEAGSAISGASPNMDVLLFGRTLQGVGGAGLFVGIFAAIANVSVSQSCAIVSSDPFSDHNTATTSSYHGIRCHGFCALFRHRTLGWRRFRRFWCNLEMVLRKSTVEPWRKHDY